jgi:hypothetical protein
MWQTDKHFVFLTKNIAPKYFVLTTEKNDNCKGCIVLLRDMTWKVLITIISIYGRAILVLALLIELEMELCNLLF